MKIHNLVAKHLHKANNRYAVHENKRESLLADAMDKELDDSLFVELESQGKDDLALSELCLDDVGTSSISISDEEE